MTAKERLVEIIKDKILHIPIAGDFDRTRAIYPNETVIDKLADAILKEFVRRSDMCKYCQFNVKKNYERKQ